MSKDWKKRDTPTPMLLVVALLAIYGASAVLVAMNEKSWLIAIAAATAFVAAVGAALLKRWSRYLVYVLAAGLVGKLGWSIYAAVEAGYFATFQTREAALKPLLPSAVLATLFLLSCWIVGRQFGRKNPATTDLTIPPS
jgi:hypothetical protein